MRVPSQTKTLQHHFFLRNNNLKEHPDFSSYVMGQSLPDRVIMATKRGCCVPSTLWHRSRLRGETPVQNTLKVSPSAPSPGLWVNTAFLPTVMKPGVFQNKYCFLVTNINKCIAHYIFGEECARPTFLKSNGEILPLFPSSPHTGKLPLESPGTYMTKNYRGTHKYFRYFFFS